MQMQKVGLEEPGANGPVYTKRDYRLPDAVFQTEAARLLTDPTSPRVDKNYYLPMAFTAGSPPHPAYGAGHATVAGACVTILKAWLDEKTPLAAHLDAKKPRNPFAASNCVPPPQNGEDAGGETILEPGCFVVIGTTNSAGQLMEYKGADKGELTVEGELNKIACNVAMGRSMGASTGVRTTRARCGSASRSQPKSSARNASNMSSGTVRRRRRPIGASPASTAMTSSSSTAVSS